MDNPTRERAAQLFAALSNPTRLHLVETLIEGPKTVNELAETVKMGQSWTSQNLAILTRAGILTMERQGTSRIYRVRGPRLICVLSLIAEFCHVHHLYGTALSLNELSVIPFDASGEVAMATEGTA